MENKRKDGKVPCMICTKEQYERDLKQPLLDMGFRDNHKGELNVDSIIAVNNEGMFGNITMTSFPCIFDRFLISPYNPELFLSEVRNCVYGGEENIDTKYPYWFINGNKQYHTRLVEENINENQNLYIELVGNTNIPLVVDKDDKRLILKTEYVEDLPIDTPVMVLDNYNNYTLRYYAGNNKCYTNIENSNKISQIQWRVIIPFDKFDPNNIEESLKYNIVKV